MAMVMGAGAAWAQQTQKGPAADKDLVAVYSKYNKDKFEVLLSTKVEAVSAKPEAIEVAFSGANAPARARCFFRYTA